MQEFPLISPSQIFLLLSLFLPSAVLLIILKKLRMQVQNLREELGHEGQERQAIEDSFNEYRQFFDQNQVALSGPLRNHNADFFEGHAAKAEMILLHIHLEGRIIRMNEYTRKILGYSEVETSLHASDFLNERQRAIFLLSSGQKIPDRIGRAFSFRVENRFGETLHLMLNCIPLDAGKSEFLVLGQVVSSQPGFGPSRNLPVLESLLFESKWPSILLEKSPKSKGMRKSRILWMSASAGKLFKTEASRTAGLTLETLSQSLASLILSINPLENEACFWQSASENSFQILSSRNGNFIWLQLIPVDMLHSAGSGQSEEDNFPETSSGIRFEGLLEITQGDSAFLKELLPTYLSALRECRTQFRRGLAEGSEDKIRFLQHKIRATIRTFGLLELEDIFQTAIQQISSGNQPDNNESTILMARINSACDKAEKAILEFARQNHLQI